MVKVVFFLTNKENDALKVSISEQLTCELFQSSIVLFSYRKLIRAYTNFFVFFLYTSTALVKDLRQNKSKEERVITLADRITKLTKRMNQLSFDRTENNAALIQTHSCAVTMWNIAVAMKTGGGQSGTTYNAKCKRLCLLITFTYK